MPYTRVFYHLVWATKGRKPHLNDDAIRQQVHNVIAAKALQLGGSVHAIGGVADHIHVVASVPPTIAIATFVGQIKGASSHFVSHTWPLSHASFEWQRSYGLLTISESHVPVVVDYVRNQAFRHSGADHQLQQRLESCD